MIRNLLKTDFHKYTQLINSNISLDMYNDFLENVLGALLVGMKAQINL